MSNFTLDISDIKNEPYAEKEFEDETDLGEAELKGQSVDVGKVSLKGKATNTKSGILVEATVAGILWLDCSRCLNRFSHPLKLAIEEFFSFKKEEEEHWLKDDTIDIGEIIIELLALNLDIKPLCKEDCAGLCPKCGTNLNKQQCKCKAKPVDIRWQKLGELKNKLSNTHLSNRKNPKKD